MSNKEKILSGISIDFIGSIIATVVGFAVVPYYFHYISTAEFGLWLAISGLSAMITMVDLGTDQYLTTVTANDEKFYSDNYNNYLTSILLIKSVVSILFSLIGIGIYYFLTSLIDIDLLHLASSQHAFIIGIIILVLSSYFSTISTILYSRHHYSLINSFITIFAIITSFLTLFLMHLEFGIVSFPLALLITTIVQHLILLAYMIKKYPNIKLNIRNFHFIDKKEVLSYTTTFQILRWVHTLRTQYITIAINNLAGATYVARYNLTNRIPQMVPIYAVKIVHPFFPTISDLFHKGEIEKIKNLFTKITKILSRLALFFSISIYFLNESFINLWVGNDKFAGEWALIWLTIYMFVYVAMNAFGIIIYASKEFGKWSFWSIIEIIIAILSSYLFSLFYGLSGIIFGFVFASMFTQIYLFLLVSKQINLNRSFFLIGVLKYSFISNFAVIIFGGVILNVHINSWIDFIVIGFGFILSGLFPDILKIIRSKETGLKNKIMQSVMP